MGGKKDSCFCLFARVHRCMRLPPACVCGQNKCDERHCGLSLDFVVERAFVARTHDAQVFLAGALDEGMNGKSVMDIEATALKWVPGRNGFVRRGKGGMGKQG